MYTPASMPLKINYLHFSKLNFPVITDSAKQENRNRYISDPLCYKQLVTNIGNCPSGPALNMSCTISPIQMSSERWSCNYAQTMCGITYWMKYVFEGEVSESQKTYFILEKRQKEKNTNTLLQKGCILQKLLRCFLSKIFFKKCIQYIQNDNIFWRNGVYMKMNKTFMFPQMTKLVSHNPYDISWGTFWASTNETEDITHRTKGWFYVALYTSFRLAEAVLRIGGNCPQKFNFQK